MSYRIRKKTRFLTCTCPHSHDHPTNSFPFHPHISTAQTWTKTAGRSDEQIRGDNNLKFIFEKEKGKQHGDMHGPWTT